jgi:hypothetical protein
VDAREGEPAGERMDRAYRWILLSNDPACPGKTDEQGTSDQKNNCLLHNAPPFFFAVSHFLPEKRARVAVWYPANQ